MLAFLFLFLWQVTILKRSSVTYVPAYSEHDQTIKGIYFRSNGFVIGFCLSISYIRFFIFP